LCEAITQFIEMENEDRALMGKLGRRKMIKEYDERYIIQVYLDKIGRYTTNVVKTYEKKPLA
jgi:hypothetical protein